MKIAVAVRGVLDTEDPSGWGAGRLEVTGAALRFNDDDDQALEAALQLREDHRADVMAVSVSPARQAEPALRRALALGVDGTLAIWDERLEGADTAATALVLAGALGKLEPQLALFGERSGDTGGGALPAYVAELLDWPFVAQAVTLSVDGSTASARRRLPGGYREGVQFDLPAVVSVASGTQTVRYAKTAQQLRADRTPLDVKRPEELGLGAAPEALRPRVRVGSLTLPKPTCAVPTAASHPSPEVRMMLALAEAGTRGAHVLSGDEAVSAAVRRLAEAGVITRSDTRGDR